MDANITLNDLYPSKWVKSDDLDGAPKIYTISQVSYEPVGPQKDMKVVLAFVGTPKRMILNVTNARIISGLYGQSPASWTGKRIILYPCEVNFQGTTSMGIRVKSIVPPQAAALRPAQVPPPPPSPEGFTDEQLESMVDQPF
jgi:hypothetical protein